MNVTKDYYCISVRISDQPAGQFNPFELDLATKEEVASFLDQVLASLSTNGLSFTSPNVTVSGTQRTVVYNYASGSITETPSSYLTINLHPVNGYVGQDGNNAVVIFQR